MPPAHPVARSTAKVGALGTLRIYVMPLGADVDLDETLANFDWTRPQEDIPRPQAGLRSVPRSHDGGGAA